mmetsp:Transcript_35222/g.109185  ORF Transcript_35222/g.109185 Transcript_35222/m.109185 type:complete len:242 (-) Transcript_35222:3059-3784(-)
MGFDVALAKPATFAFAHAMSSGSATAVPSPFNCLSMSMVCARMSCHMTARMSFLLPSAMSTPPMFTKTNSNFLPTVTQWLPFSTTWWRFFGKSLTFFHGTQPGWTLSMTARIGTPLQHSRNKSRICTASVALGPAQASSELIQSLNVRASRVSPASSRSNPASSLATSSSTASKPGRSLKSCATNARLSFEFAAATSLALMNGAKKRPALSRTCCARFVRSGTLRSTGLISEPYSCFITMA